MKAVIVFPMSRKREKEEMERKHRRLCEKAERLDEEKMEANTTISQLRDEISSIHRYVNLDGCHLIVTFVVTIGEFPLKSSLANRRALNHGHMANSSLEHEVFS